MPRKKTARGSSKESGGPAVTSIQYAAKRKNIPPAGLEAQGRVREAPKIRYEFNPHLPPALRSSPEAADTDRLPELLSEATRRALSTEEAEILAQALSRHEPWLEWSGKRERPWFEVDPVALHMHERVSTQAILRVLARQDVQRDLFADPQLDYARAVQSYRHDVDWANRMILGDSLQVMASLARREDLPDKGKWSKLARALGRKGLVEEGAFDKLSGLSSLPFPRPSRLGKGEIWRIAVKVIDPRGNEGLRVLTMKEDYS